MKNQSINQYMYLAIVIFCFISNELKAYDLTISVGPVSDSQCTLNNIEAAIAAVPTESSALIKVVGSNSGFEINNNLVILNKNITIVGGYTTCSTSSNHLNPTIINGNSIGSPVFSIIGFSSTYETVLKLQNVIVTNGEDEGGAGIRAVGKSHVILESSQVNNNTSSENGGGVFLNKAKLTINYNSKISNNSASLYGGGIYCEKGGEIEFRNGEINSNTAEDGAGIFMDNCILNGTLGNGDKSISHNRGKGDGDGVGLLIQNDSQIEMGNENSLTVIKDNIRQEVKSGGTGGALFLNTRSSDYTILPPSYAKFINTHFIDNENENGGAIASWGVGNQIELVSTNSCITSDLYRGCSSLQGNIATGEVRTGADGGVIACGVYGGQGGAVYMIGGNILIDDVHIIDNQATRHGCFGNDNVHRTVHGSALHLEGSGSKGDFIDVIISGNKGTHTRSIISLDDSQARFIHSTIAYNKTNDIEATIDTRGTKPKLELLNSIIEEGNGDIYDYSRGEDSVLLSKCNMVSDLSQLSNGGYGTEEILSTIEDNPDFYDTQWFNLSVSSPALDSCSTNLIEELDLTSYIAYDIKGKARPHIIYNQETPLDLGAVEYKTGGYFGGHSDLAIEINGPQSIPLNENIHYKIDIINNGPNQANQAQVVIRLDEDTGQQWIDYSFDNDTDWDCEVINHSLNCKANRSLLTNSNLSPIYLDLSADVEGSTITTHTNVSDLVSLDPISNNSNSYLQTNITASESNPPEDIIFLNGFE